MAVAEAGLVARRQFSAHMGSLVLEVLTKPDHLPIARAQVAGISRLSLSQPVSGFYTLVSPTSEKLGEVQVSMNLEPLTEAYNGSSLGPTKDISPDRMQVPKLTVPLQPISLSAGGGKESAGSSGGNTPRFGRVNEQIPMQSAAPWTVFQTWIKELWICCLAASGRFGRSKAGDVEVTRAVSSKVTVEGNGFYYHLIQTSPFKSSQQVEEDPEVLLHALLMVPDGSSRGNLRVLLAMGRAEQIVSLQRTRDEEYDSLSHVVRPVNTAQVKIMREHVFVIRVEKVSGLTPLQSTVWGEADCYVQYTFPSQEFNAASDVDQSLIESSLSLKPFRTTTTLCVPDPVFGHTETHVLLAPEGVPVQRLLLSSLSSKGLSNIIIPMSEISLWPGDCFPCLNCVQWQPCRGNILSRLRCSPCPWFPGLRATQDFNLNLQVYWMCAFDTSIGLSNLKIKLVEERLPVLAISEENDQFSYLMDVGLNPYITVHLSFLPETERRCTRTVARTFCPEFDHHIEVTCDMLLHMSSISGWFGLNLVCENRPSKPEHILVGGLEVSISFAHHSDRERVIKAAQGLGWEMPKSDCAPLDDEECWEEGMRKLSLTFSMPKAWLPLHCLLLPGLRELQRSTYCYLRYKFFDQDAFCSRLKHPCVEKGGEGNQAMVSFEGSRTVELRTTQPLMWYLREEKLEVQVWVTFSKNRTTRPSDSDRLLGSAFVDLSSLAKTPMQKLSLRVYPLFMRSAADLQGAALRVHITSSAGPIPTNLPAAHDTQVDSDIQEEILLGEVEEANGSLSSFTPRKPSHDQSTHRSKPSRTTPDITSVHHTEVSVEDSFPVTVAVDRAMHLNLKGECIT
ncbi:hypothetical protein GOODEAATRI_011176 [Goodea atripinnis]|uniref:C2CD3 N-terminal C2 domain-containing protein n=1 Tax=Goodea atripinnis TaxID=208336 RepID=A0ABV0N9Q2_9TELE